VVTAKVTAPVARQVAMAAMPITTAFYQSLLHWLRNLTPERAKHLGRIVGNFVYNLCGLPNTEAGIRAVQGGTRTLQAGARLMGSPEGRNVIVEGASLLVHLAEALDTPETHAFIKKGTSMYTNLFRLLASSDGVYFAECAADLFRLNIEMANAPETVELVAEAVANLSAALKDEYERTENGDVGIAAKQAGKPSAEGVLEQTAQPETDKERGDSLRHDTSRSRGSGTASDAGSHGPDRSSLDASAKPPEEDPLTAPLELADESSIAESVSEPGWPEAEISNGDVAHQAASEQAERKAGEGPLLRQKAAKGVLPAKTVDTEPEDIEPEDIEPEDTAVRRHREEEMSRKDQQYEDRVKRFAALTEAALAKRQLPSAAVRVKKMGDDFSWLGAVLGVAVIAWFSLGLYGLWVLLPIGRVAF